MVQFYGFGYGLQVRSQRQLSFSHRVDSTPPTYVREPQLKIAYSATISSWLPLAPSPSQVLLFRLCLARHPLTDVSLQFEYGPRRRGRLHGSQNRAMTRHLGETVHYRPQERSSTRPLCETSFSSWTTGS